MLYCITANYTPKAMEAMAKNPDANRKEAVEKLVGAAGGKLIAMYGTLQVVLLSFRIKSFKWRAPD